MYHTVFPAPLMGHHFLPSKWCSLPIIWFVSGSVQFNSVAQSCPTLCNPMDCSMPGFPVHHQLSELAQTHVHWIGDAIQPSHLLLSPSPPAFNLSQHQGLFKWVSFRIRWPKYWSFSFSINSSNCLNIQDWLPLGWTGLISLQSKGLSRVFSNQIRSDEISRSVMSDSLRPHESQHARPPCPSPTPGVHSDSRPSSQWCHPAISSCRPLLLLPPIPPSVRVFSNESTLPMRWPKYWSFSFSIIPSKEILGLISLQSKGLSKVFSNTTVQKHQFFSVQPSSQSNSHIHTWPQKKP